jgi:CheY-like chemotaxis protein
MATVLVADDDPYLVDLCASLLEQEGFDVLTANDGGEAYQRFMSNKIDVALIDIMMPVMDGVSLCMKLKREHNIETPLITTSASGTLLEQSEACADATLPKPFELDALLQVIYMFTAPEEPQTQAL